MTCTPVHCTTSTYCEFVCVVLMLVSSLVQAHSESDVEDSIEV
jgi:hypothetical protein